MNKFIYLFIYSFLFCLIVLFEGSTHFLPFASSFLDVSVVLFSGLSSPLKLAAHAKERGNLSSIKLCSPFFSTDSFRFCALSFCALHSSNEYFEFS